MMVRKVGSKRSQAHGRAVQALCTFAAVYAVLHLTLPLYIDRHPNLTDTWFSDRFVRIQSRCAEEGEPRPPLVIMTGSSRVGDGFDGQRVEEVLRAEAGGRSLAFNMGMPGAGTIAQLVWWNRMFDAGIRPDLAVIEVMPTLLLSCGGEKPPEMRWFQPERLRYSEVELVERYGLSMEGLRDYREGLWANPWRTLRGPLLARTLPLLLAGSEEASFARNDDRYGRAPTYPANMPAEMRLLLKKKSLEASAQPLREGVSDPHCIAAARDLLGSCRKHGVQAVLVLMPEGSEFRALYSPEVEGRLATLLRDLEQEFGISTIDARLWVPDEGFFDDVHLLPSGAAQFSEIFARKVLSTHLKPRIGLSVAEKRHGVLE